MWEKIKRTCFDLGLIFVLFAFAVLVGGMNAKAARFQFGGIVEQITSTATAGGTTALTSTSTQIQIFTGSSNQTVTLPDATTTRVGWYFWIVNDSTGVITVNDNGGTLVQTVNAGDSARISVTSVSSAAGTWSSTSVTSSGISFDIDGLTEDATIATGDFVSYYDTGNAVNRKIDFDDLVTAIATDNINRVSAQAIATGDDVSFYDSATGQSAKIDFGTLQDQLASVISASLDINGQAAAPIATGDEIIFFDSSASANRKIDFDDLKTAIATDNINRLTAQAIATGDFVSFYDAGTGESSKIDFGTLQDQITDTVVVDSAATDSVWDAILGSAAQVTAGRATHSDFDTAMDALSAEQSLFILPGTHSCTGTSSKVLHIRGVGRGSILDCAFTIPATQSHNWISGVKFTDNLTIATGASGNVINPVWFDDTKGTVNAGDASGNANYIVEFTE